MCLYIEKEKHKNLCPRYATQDIKVIKMLRTDGLTPYRKMPIQFHTLLESPLNLSKTTVTANYSFCTDGDFQSCFNAIVEEGLHAFSSIRTAIFWRERLNRDPNWKSILIGDVELYDAIIPKGSWYYYGKNGDVVSDKMFIGDRFKNPTSMQGNYWY